MKDLKGMRSVRFGGDDDDGGKKEKVLDI
jgi:hypothetical protein